MSKKLDSVGDVALVVVMIAGAAVLMMTAIGLAVVLAKEMGWL